MRGGLQRAAMRASRCLPACTHAERVLRPAPHPHASQAPVAPQRAPSSYAHTRTRTRTPHTHARACGAPQGGGRPGAAGGACRGGGRRPRSGAECRCRCRRGRVLWRARRCAGPRVWVVGVCGVFRPHRNAAARRQAAAGDRAWVCGRALGVWGGVCVRGGVWLGKCSSNLITMCVCHTRPALGFASRSLQAGARGLEGGRGCGRFVVRVRLRDAPRNKRDRHRGPPSRPQAPCLLPQHVRYRALVARLAPLPTSHSVRRC